jgi:hypothetical protein
MNFKNIFTLLIAICLQMGFMANAATITINLSQENTYPETIVAGAQIINVTGGEGFKSSNLDDKSNSGICIFYVKNSGAGDEICASENVLKQSGLSVGQASLLLLNDKVALACLAKTFEDGSNRTAARRTTCTNISFNFSTKKN